MRREINVNLKSDSPQPSFWGSVERVSKALALVALPVVLGVIGHAVDRRAETEVLAKEYLNLAIGVLSGETGTTPSPQMEQWAQSILTEYSPVPVPEDIDFRVLFSIEGTPVHQVQVDGLPSDTARVPLSAGSFLFVSIQEGTITYLGTDSTGNKYLTKRPLQDLERLFSSGQSNNSLQPTGLRPAAER